MVSRQAMKGRAPFAGALSAVVKLYRKYRPTARIYGDVDNHLKALFDGMNEIVFVDDSQIVRCVVEKHKDADNPRADEGMILWTSGQMNFLTLLFALL